MRLADADVLFGKLAIGRGLLTRADALRVAREVCATAERGRPESLETTAARLGFLSAADATALSAVLSRGHLICRGRCAARFPLARVTPQQAERCARCGGPLFVARERDGQRPRQSEQRAAGHGAGEEPLGSTTLELDLPADLGAVTAEPAEPTRFATSRDEPSVGAATTATTATPATPATTATPEPDLEESGGMTIELDLPDFAAGAARTAPPPQDPRAAPTSAGAAEFDAGDGEGGQTFLEIEYSPDGGSSAAPQAAAPEPAEAGASGGATRLGKKGTFMEIEVPLDLLADEDQETPSRDEDETLLAPAQPDGGPAVGADVGAGASAPTPDTWVSRDTPAQAFTPFTVRDLDVQRQIGRGGMGSVFFARRRGDGASLAVKVLTNQTDALAEEVLARFRREVQLTAQLFHPNIVRVYEAGVVMNGEHSGRPYFSMDFVEGRDLGVWARERRRTPAEAVRMMVPVCEAMDYAHGRGVVHRDLKPGNVLVRSADDTALVCDFGLAKVRAEVQSLTRTGDVLGTPSYMPPEQALGNRQKIGPPTDVYALGAILYFLLTGRPPFTGPSTFAIIDKVVRSAPEPPSSVAPGVPADLEAITLKALAKEPVARYHTAGDLVRALQAC